MQSEAHRLFVAIVVPDAVRDAIESAQAELRKSVPVQTVRWARREQFHLTLKFLGNVAVNRIAALDASLSRATAAVAPLRLRAEGIGFFPGVRSPRVIWAGVRDEKELLTKLHAIVEDALKEFPSEKPEGKFIGHVTLGRAAELKRPQAELLATLAQTMAGRCFGEWSADELELIRSELTPQGSRYTTVGKMPLAA